jgi:uncharacterized CHY-type Zn-finger protein
MVCEKCAQEIETVICGRCNTTVARMGEYCYACGARLEEKREREAEADDDFDNRVLCSDGTCIGVINEKGVCKVCGKPYEPESV